MTEPDIYEDLNGLRAISPRKVMAIIDRITQIQDALADAYLRIDRDEEALGEKDEYIAELEGQCREKSYANIDFLQRWMRTPNPTLGNATPIEMMRNGLGNRVAAFIDSAFIAETGAEHLVKYGDETVEISTDPAGKDQGCSIVYRRLPNGNIEIMGEQFMPVETKPWRCPCGEQAIRTEKCPACGHANYAKETK